MSDPSEQRLKACGCGMTENGCDVAGCRAAQRESLRTGQGLEPEIAEPDAVINAACPTCGPQSFVTFVTVRTLGEPDVPGSARCSVGWVCSSCGGDEYVAG